MAMHGLYTRIIVICISAQFDLSLWIILLTEFTFFKINLMIQNSNAQDVMGEDSYIIYYSPTFTFPSGEYRFILNSGYHWILFIRRDKLNSLGLMLSKPQCETEQSELLSQPQCETEQSKLLSKP